MLRVADCLVEIHDLKLVVAAAAVCIGGSSVAFRLYPRTLSDRDRLPSPFWLALTGIAAGASVWSTHFIAMLAFQPAMPTGFDPWIMLASFAVAISLTTAAFGLASNIAGLTGRLMAGSLLGIATVAMHYTGISGLRLPGDILWNYRLLGLSVVFSIAFATAALVAAGRGATVGQRVAGTALFALSIVSLHFTGMAALEIVPDPSRTLPPDLLSGDVLGYAVAIATLIVVGCALAAWAIDRRSRRDNDQRLRFMARHDMLTSLPNRVLFEEIASREIASGGGGGRTCAVLCLDLDGFKEVNDVFGHGTGDRLLVEVGRRLQGLLGERCVAARLGGDEFAVLATGLGGTNTPDRAAQRVLEAVGAPYDIDGYQLDVGCSVGIATYPSDGETYPALLSHADSALSRAKADGKGVFRFFEAAMDEAAHERRRLAVDLRAALRTGQIRLEYQPQTSVETGQICGFEALVRWDHPDRGSIPPSVFIPVAEDTGVILGLGEWVLREACREAASWAAPLRIAVNLSIAQFRQTGLAELVKSILDETGLPAHRLELEVTESLFLENGARALSILEGLKRLGVLISMDDFGTGYSSLSTLQSYPFDKIKIDRSFIAQIGHTRKGTAIVKAIVGLGESLGMQVVAEGVEREDQLAFLRDLHCGEIQGYLCGKPRPIGFYRGIVSGTTKGTPDGSRSFVSPERRFGPARKKLALLGPTC